MPRNILPAITESDNLIPDHVIGYVSVRGKESVFDNPKKGLHRSASAYHAKPKDIETVRRDLERSGFVLDSLQLDDLPDYQGLLQLFPQSYHEPFYASYTKEDFPALALDCRLTHLRNVVVFVSKVMVFDKPSALNRPALA